jgi:hypothetical protein
MARKKKRRLGHITAEDRFKVSTALSNAGQKCMVEFHGNADDRRYEDCLKGVRFSSAELEKKGFEPFR